MNLAWRNMVAEPSGNRVSMERAVIYFPKERVRNFMRHELSENDLLRDAVIFAVEENGPLNLVSFKPPEPRPDFRPAIHEDNLAATPLASKPTVASGSAPKPALGQNIEAQGTVAKNELRAEKAPVSTASTKPIAMESNSKTMAETATLKNPPVAKAPVTPPISNVRAEPTEEATTESVTATKKSENGLPAAEPKKAEARAEQRTEKVAEQYLLKSPSSPVVEAKKVAPVSPTTVAEAPKPDAQAIAPKIVAEPEKAEVIVKEKPAVIAVAPAAPGKAVEPLIVESKPTGSPPSIENAETRPVKKSSAAEAVKPSVMPKSVEQKSPDATSSTVPAVRTAGPTQPAETAKPAPLASVAKIDTPPVVEPKPAPVVVIPAPVATIPKTPRPMDSAKPNPLPSVAKVESPKTAEVKSSAAAVIPVPPAKTL
ncbi:MAG TPA: hypothetical protein VNT76_03730, partial [Candidatus Binatus sp.]|nr:hypothetical protein [Candidatus Binatus sp.]